MSKRASPMVIGGFVMGAVVLLIAVALIFSTGQLMTERPTYVLFFEGDMGGLGVGAPVTFRGVKVGLVTDIQVQYDPKDMSVQIPVFIALYWALLESVDLRQAPFIFWIKDLSVMDPYFVLPVLMGISMVIQQRLNPPPPDPIQAKIMMALPFIFTVFFAFFPSGLVLYWVVNNVLSITQQYIITRRIEAGATK